jgi:hypothetical protein
MLISNRALLHNVKYVEFTLLATSKLTVKGSEWRNM